MVSQENGVRYRDRQAEWQCRLTASTTDQRVFGNVGVSSAGEQRLIMLQSSARFTSLIIATPDGQIAVSLWQRGGIPEFSLEVQWRDEPEREQAVRRFFSERGLSTSEDYLAGNGGVSDATRCLGYFLPANVQFVTALTKDVLRQVYGVGEHDALDFSLKEHQDAA